MKAKEWEEVLLEATGKVRTKVSEIASKGKRTQTVGVGASGDRTILADKRAEEILLGALGSLGSMKVLSEEAGFAGEKDASTLTIVDPLDGSSNFEKGIPFYCTSVAIAEGRTLRDVTFGIVRDLISGDVYVASKNKGATKNGRRILTSKVANPSDAVVGIDLSRSTPELVSKLAPLVSSVKRQVHLGANALEMCYLAEGRIDAFVDIRGKIRIMDFAAAYLVAREAGGVITDPEGKELRPEFNLNSRLSFVGSSNENIHKEILQLCRG